MTSSRGAGVAFGVGDGVTASDDDALGLEVDAPPEGELTVEHEATTSRISPNLTSEPAPRRWACIRTTVGSVDEYATSHHFPSERNGVAGAHPCALSAHAAILPGRHDASCDVQQRPGP
jgi:hypothetical protein